MFQSIYIACYSVLKGTLDVSGIQIAIFLFLQENMLWVLIGIVSPRYF